MMYPHIVEQLSLFGDPAVAENLESEVLGNLNSGLPDATGSGMDQDRFASFHSGQFVDRVVRCQENRRQGRGIDMLHRGRLAEYHAAMHRHIAAETVGCHSDNGISLP